MSEISDLVVVLGQLERAVAELAVHDPGAAQAARAAAGELIPPLADPGTIGWYDRFVEATGFDPDAEGLPEATVALRRRPAAPEVISRRLIVVAAVARALESFPPGSDRDAAIEAVLVALQGDGILATTPSVFTPLDPDPEHDDTDTGAGPVGGGIERALGDTGTGPALGDDDDHRRQLALQLLDMLRDRQALPDVSAYQRFLEEADARKLISADLFRVPGPCTTLLARVPGGDGAEPALALITRVCVEGVSLADLAADPGKFLNPAQWANYSYWCRMVDEGGSPLPFTDPQRLFEEVALVCAPKDDDKLFPVSVWLDFSRLQQIPGAVVRDYSMTPVGLLPAMPTANGAVDVDEGTIKVAEEDGHLRVTTTKRVRFTSPLIDEPVLAVLSCALGYGALAADFVVRGTAGKAREVTCVADATSRTFGDAGADALGGSVARLMGTADDCIGAARDAARRALVDGYTADTLVADVGQAVGRALRAWVQAVDVVIVAGGSGRQAPVVTGSFCAERDPNVRTGPCGLRPAGELRSLNAFVMPPDRVTLLPARLDNVTTPFTLSVDPRGLRGGTYLGKVVVTVEQTGAIHEVDVDVQIP